MNDETNENTLSTPTWTKRRLYRLLAPCALLGSIALSPMLARALDKPYADFDTGELIEAEPFNAMLTELYERATPTGGIILWSGPLDAIPAGWALCDGSVLEDPLDPEAEPFVTPNLTDRFVVGAGASYCRPRSAGRTRLPSPSKRFRLTITATPTRLARACGTSGESRPGPLPLHNPSQASTTAPS
ncbi:hypothetical protein PPSIR1_42181 [Plesiocystis pacifica SIR-1]|uniref:Uncharacterized protein n=1 Tax=Plesiocystis pacifica SIR-1 TaxID=391625 RepID=A6GCZ2_9BACT|nr:phage tail protein [Plesiocystis pacifica]EDM76230.1 hypothetical protein PPSIR1_42181 [Plesiocystis pacifica SIR-1]